nr:MAG TPA: hypothetical protein [Caudoviricetes sp.]
MMFIYFSYCNNEKSPIAKHDLRTSSQFVLQPD